MDCNPTGSGVYRDRRSSSSSSPSKGAVSMRNARRPLSMSLALVLAATPALAQQPLQESARRAATAAAAQPSAGTDHRVRFITGAIVASAGGAAIVLGMTALKTAD